MLRGWFARLRRWRRPQLALLALVLVVGVGYGVDALRSSAAPHPSAAAPALATVALSSLPPQVTDTVHRIESDGPFPYSQDGVVFDNNEHLLPAQKRGYYHEYTVATPGASDRATRRIVTGGTAGDASAREFFYTADHYETFQRVDITR
jgi:ribonuclease T1